MPTTPSEWLDALDQKLEGRRRRIELCESYYRGDHRLEFNTNEFRKAFGAIMDSYRNNWMALVVDASVERLSIEGFRFGGKDADADREAWAIWQANNLDAESVMAHTEAGKCGEANLLVGPGQDAPEITVEHPLQTVVAHSPGRRRDRQAALKKWLDDDGHVHAYVYLPEGVYKYRSAKPYRVGARVEWRAQGSERNPAQVVPMVPLRNNPSLVDGGRSDLQDAIPIQDGINMTIRAGLVAAEYEGFRQRWVTGIDIPTDDDGNALDREQFLSAVSRMWAVPDDAAKFGEFGQIDLGQYVAWTRAQINQLAAVTRTPPHYILGEIVNASGDALKAAETGLVAKVRRKQLDYADGWEEAMRLAFRFVGDTRRATATDAETIWGNPESRPVGATVDAAVKLRESLSLPLEMCWEFIGLSPQQIDRAKDLINLPAKAGETPPRPPANTPQDQPVAVTAAATPPAVTAG